MAMLNKREFVEAHVSKDLGIDEPEEMLNVHYGEAREVVTGGVITPREVRAKPQVTWEANSEKYYTLLLIDIDWPSRDDRKDADFLCWSVVNIEGKVINSGHTAAEYLGPIPGKDTGLHRLVFLLFEQKRKIPYHKPTISEHSIEGREHFNTAQFVYDNELHTPVAGTFFQARWDEYVQDMLQKKLCSQQNPGSKK